MEERQGYKRLVAGEREEYYTVVGLHCHPWCVGESGAAREGWYAWSRWVALDEQIIRVWRSIPMDACMSQDGNFVFRPKGDGQPCGGVGWPGGICIS